MSIDDDVMKSLRPYDVVCGRGTNSFNNVGNRRFRIFIGLHLSKYTEAEGRLQKGHVIKSLVHALTVEMGARFLRIQEGRLVELKESQIRQKVGHALRDMASFNASSTGRTKPTPSVLEGAHSDVEEVRPFIPEHRNRNDTSESKSTTDQHNSLLLPSPKGFDVGSGINDIGSFQESQTKSIKAQANLKSESSPESIANASNGIIKTPTSENVTEFFDDSLFNVFSDEDDNQPKRHG
jgi:hypothetical protein